jgi:hypothetical protein
VSPRTANLERDVAIVRAMADDFQDYVLSDHLYWSLSRRGPRSNPYPKFTLGGLFLRIHHLDLLAGRLSPDIYQAYAQARERIHMLMSQWASHVERKVLDELPSRLRAWSAFLAECEDNAAECTFEYPTACIGRTIIDLLLEQAGPAAEGSDLHAQLARQDQLLRALAAETDFVWDPVLMPAYPQERFWWLYTRPQAD